MNRSFFYPHVVHSSHTQVIPTLPNQESQQQQGEAQAADGGLVAASHEASGETRMFSTATREHAVVCRRCLITATYNDSGICHGCESGVLFHSHTRRSAR